MLLHGISGSIPQTIVWPEYTYFANLEAFLKRLCGPNIPTLLIFPSFKPCPPAVGLHRSQVAPARRPGLRRETNNLEKTFERREIGDHRVRECRGRINLGGRALQP